MEGELRSGGRGRREPGGCFWQVGQTNNATRQSTHLEFHVDVDLAVFA